MFVRSAVPPPLLPRSMKTSLDIPITEQGRGCPRKGRGEILGAAFCDPSLTQGRQSEGGHGDDRKGLFPFLIFFFSFFPG